MDRVEAKLKELLAKDIIETVSGPSRWVSPMVVVIKDSGDIRLCIDMRQVNKAILRETYPLPTIEDIRWKLNGAMYFSRLDIKDAFYQLELDDESLFRYKRLVFGISCAPEIFRKIIEQVLSDCDNCINFIDDIIIVGKNEQEHDKALRKVLDKLKDYDILLNQLKCAFKLTEIEFLGHHFNKEGMTPSQSKVKAIKNFRLPESCEEVRSFLGLVNYVGAFIPNLATISATLRELTKDKAVFKWGSEEESAFQHIVHLIGRVETLSHFDPKLKTRVVADASLVALGAVLLQFYEGEPRVISYASKSLTDTERRYAQTEKEALALVWAVERFQIYLFGIRFELKTDHKPLKTIFSPNSSPCLRIERWVLRLQAFSYDVVYRKGKSNIADPLSRLSRSSDAEAFDPDSEVYIRSVLELAAIDIDEFEASSANDPELSELRECLNRGIWNYSSDCIKPYHAFRNELGKVGDLIVRGSKLIVPKGLRQRMLQLAHEGHPGQTKMQQRLRYTYWWPGMDDTIARTVNSCEGCRLVSLPERPEPMQRRMLPDTPWCDVAIDFLGPLPSGDYHLVIIDYFSRYKEIEILRKITASETAARLEPIFVRLGYPRTITLNNGRQFVSREFEEYCDHRGIILNKTTPYWPQENGLVERQNRDWRSTTGKTPGELMYGRNIRTKLPSLRDVTTSVPTTDYRDRDQQLKEKGKDLEDSRRNAKPSGIEIGDKVLMKNVLPRNKLTPKFDPTVMQVTAKQGPRVTVQNCETGKTYDRNSSHLKKLLAEDSTVQDTPESTDKGVDIDSAQDTTSTQRLEPPSSCNDKLVKRSQRKIKRPSRFEDCLLKF
ncbi:uncharacterized protein K02A2.6-like [Topomyia yanbarensis]|uniref:uncharacterized protein K02A2.6-like n=1 Tax=Topomyia yanbarensis TaxID=2498891 RepID=UPI00273C9EEF|nr:uncharacterized protein K02A2.6-like [Topomyia yanbarensis]